MYVPGLISMMKFKRDNIKADIEPKVFNEVVEVLEDYEHVNERYYSVLRDNYELMHENGLLRERLKQYEGDNKYNGISSVRK